MCLYGWRRRFLGSGGAEGGGERARRKGDEPQRARSAGQSVSARPRGGATARHDAVLAMSGSLARCSPLPRPLRLSCRLGRVSIGRFAGTPLLLSPSHPQ